MCPHGGGRLPRARPEDNEQAGSGTQVCILILSCRMTSFRMCAVQNITHLFLEHTRTASSCNAGQEEVWHNEFDHPGATPSLPSFTVRSSQNIATSLFKTGPLWNAEAYARGMSANITYSILWVRNVVHSSSSWCWDCIHTNLVYI